MLLKIESKKEHKCKMKYVCVDAAGSKRVTKRMVTHIRYRYISAYLCHVLRLQQRSKLNKSMKYS